MGETTTGKIEAEGVDTHAAGHLEAQPDVSGTEVGAPGLIQSGDGGWLLDGKPLADSKGTLFHPELHQVDGDGRPKLTPRSRKAMRLPGGAFDRAWARLMGSSHPETHASIPPGGAIAPPGPSPGAIGGAPPIDDARAFHTLATLTVANIETLGQMIGGERWKYRKQPLDERETLTEAWEGYYRARGIRDLPPEWGLVAAMALYAGPRIEWGKVRDRLRTGAQRAGLVKRTRDPQTDGPAPTKGDDRARADRGNDRKR